MPPAKLPPFLLAAFQAAHRHPRRVSAGVAVLLGGFAAAAFGIAPMVPDPASLPRQTLTEELKVEHLQDQLEALADHTLDLHRSTVTRKSDTADSLLRRLGVSDPAAATFVRQDVLARLLVLDNQPGKMLQARVGNHGQLLELVARFPALEAEQATTHFSRLSIHREGEVLRSTLETAPLETQVRLGSAGVRGTLWAAVDDARLPDAIAAQMIEIFSGDMDFHREIRRGDSFSVLFESLTADGEPISWNEGTGRVLAAEYRNRGRRFQALWYADPDTGKGAYYAFDGKSRRKPFLASPMEFSRVTSGFAMRIHPLANTWRQHNGVDYAAPTGTPIKAVGDGQVEFAGQQSGYGNVVQIKHAGGKSTLYAHLSRIDVRAGEAINQGQTLGAVGATGWATGPHLHFEFKVNGQYVDPLEYAATDLAPRIDAVEKPRFLAWAQTAKHKLAAADSVSRFRGDAE